MNLDNFKLHQYTGQTAASRDRLSSPLKQVKKIKLIFQLSFSPYIPFTTITFKQPQMNSYVSKSMKLGCLRSQMLYKGLHTERSLVLPSLMRLLSRGEPKAKFPPSTPLSAFKFIQQTRNLSHNTQNIQGRTARYQVWNNNFTSQKRFNSIKPPTKESFIAQGNNFISRTWLKLKWILLRQNRPFNIDEVSAFVSWILMGNAIWIAIGTTTFVGLIIYISNFILGDDELNQSKFYRKIMLKLVTLDNNLNIKFDSENFRTSFKDGKIKFNNISFCSKENDANLFNYNLKADSVKITLSFSKYYSGKGLIDDVEIHGLRGDFVFNDTTAINNKETSTSTIPTEDIFKNYEFGSFKISDSKVDIHGIEQYNKVYNESFKLINDSLYNINSIDINNHSQVINKPIHLAVFNCDMDKLRTSWIVYDFFNSNSCAGTINESLFTIHKRQNQVAYFAGLDEIQNEQHPSPWGKASTLRIDQIDLPYTDKNSKFNWIKSCKVDLIADIMLPTDEDDEKMSIKGWGESIRSSFENLFNFNKFNKNNDDDMVLSDDTSNTSKYVVIDVKVRFQDLKATMPDILPHSTLHGQPYILEEDMRSLVNFINDKKFGLINVTGEALDTEENPFDGTELNRSINDNSNNGSSSSLHNTVGGNNNQNPLPPIKFRVLQKLEDCQLIDLFTLLSFNNTLNPKGDEKIDLRHETNRDAISFVNTNKLMDSVISELITCLLLYKEEIQHRILNSTTKRSASEIFFNNFVLGNLILVGFAAFMI